MLIDTHCHLEWNSYDADRDAVVRRAEQNDVRRLLTIGTNLPDARKTLAIVQTYPNVYGAFGIHPHDSQTADAAVYAELKAMAGRPKIVAYGEIGLDFFKNYSPREAQLAAFAAQVRLARELDLPIIIHDREAHEATLAILRAEGGSYRGVFHCFAGDEKMAEEVLALGFHLSFTGSITYENKSKAHRIIREMPFERLMLETDSPFLTPVPHRRERNEPAYVRLVADQVAAIRQEPVDEVIRQTTLNAYQLFKFENQGRRPEIAYEYKGALYLNLTSRCTNRCSFCAKFPAFTLDGHYLALERREEPTVAEVLDAIREPAKYPEIVFCGFGEPTLRWNDLIQIAKALKSRGARRIRLNTNGHADLINKRAVAPEMKGAIDAVSVSLNAPDAAAYRELCRPAFGERTFSAVVEFIRRAKQFVPEVVASVVEVPGLNVAAARRLAEESLGVPLRVR
ncbi:MAG: YchF/TatD family DNA exonuclease [Myxococcales bacterium]|nr:YchF/TatD family DNA exonuclease [Myxococcales bacterium]